MSVNRRNKTNQDKKPTIVTINGIDVRLIFTTEKNTEVPAIIAEILKCSYLRRPACTLEAQNV